MPENIINSLISSILGGLSVALVNHFLTRARTAAETAKLLAEAAKIQAETEKIKVEMHKLTETVQDVREQVLNTFHIAPDRQIVMTESEQTIKELQ